MAVALLTWCLVRADVGDPQVRTDHPEYPGELACSTFERLFAEQAKAFARAYGRPPTTDEDKALASFRWRCLHYAHGEEGRCPLFTPDFQHFDNVTRDYWTGLFAHGIGLCGTTHAQWAAEFEALLGPGRSRVCGVPGHNSHEVFLTGGPYGAGKWVLLDHDVATVVFGPDGGGLLGLAEILKPKDQPLLPRPRSRQGKWPIAGLHRDDHASYSAFNTVEYRAGFAGAPPRVHLRPGERFRRYLRPGLEDGKTFVYWGRNANAEGIPGPARDRTFVNDPAAFARGAAKWQPGRFRYGNAVFAWTPRFRELGTARLEFASPYVIAAQPATAEAWGCYQPGGTLGVVVRNARCAVTAESPRLPESARRREPRKEHDFTDAFKGSTQWALVFDAPLDELDAMGIEIVTVCQANPATMPRLREGGTTVEYEATGWANLPSRTRVFRSDDPEARKPATLGWPELPEDRPWELHAAAQVASGNPPDPKVNYAIGGGNAVLVKDWHAPVHAGKPADQWSQSFVWGSAAGQGAPPREVVFSNTGKKPWRRLAAAPAVQVGAGVLEARFAYHEGAVAKTATHTVRGPRDQWRIDTGKDVATDWVEFAVP